MKIVITGASGTIGNVLMKCLKKRHGNPFDISDARRHLSYNPQDSSPCPFENEKAEI